jgi:hypothetical protein
LRGRFVRKLRMLAGDILSQTLPMEIPVL